MLKWGRNVATIVCTIIWTINFWYQILNYFFAIYFTYIISLYEHRVDYEAVQLTLEFMWKFLQCLILSITLVRNLIIRSKCISYGKTFWLTSTVRLFFTAKFSQSTVVWTSYGHLKCSWSSDILWLNKQTFTTRRACNLCMLIGNQTIPLVCIVHV